MPLEEVVRRPVVSEKSFKASEERRTHVFEVAPDADKAAVKKAVEKMFSVKVEDVRILNQRGKRVRSRVTRRLVGQRRTRRKAYVRLAEGSDINFSETA
jgi:large subunit ribosomal protein L23